MFLFYLPLEVWSKSNAELSGPEPIGNGTRLFIFSIYKYLKKIIKIGKCDTTRQTRHLTCEQYKTFLFR